MISSKPAEKATKSRQTRWQEKQKAAGKCILCPKNSEKWGLCERHLAMSIKRRRKTKGVLKPYHDKSKWAEVDLNRPTNELAVEMGVTVGAVRYQRRLRG